MELTPSNQNNERLPVELLLQRSPQLVPLPGADPADAEDDPPTKIPKTKYASTKP
jgi:hypothetical protein